VVVSEATGSRLEGAVAPWRPLASRPVEARRRTQGDAAAAVNTQPLAGPLRNGSDAPPSRASGGLAAGWSGSRSAGFLAQLIGQSAEYEDRTPPSRVRPGVGAYETATRFSNAPSMDREGLVVLPPLSTGHTFDLSI